jgi:hypothetical protein
LAISHPVAVYNAENNVEAQLICTYLDLNGIEAYPTLDDSLAGFWSFGVLPGIHKPQVWVDKSNVDAAQPLLVEYERERRRRQSTRPTDEDLAAGSVDVVCEECGKTTAFPASKNGTTQDCSHCFVDVGDEPIKWADS